MVCLLICPACQIGEHDKCEGTKNPQNASKNQLVCGGSRCICFVCLSKLQKQENTES